MHHNSVFNITPRDSCDVFFFCGDLATWCWLSPCPYMSSCLCGCICAAYFPLCFSSFLTISLFSLFNLPLSPFGSVIVILKQPLSFPPFSLCLSWFPCCSFPRYKDVFLVNTYYLALSSSLSSLFPSLSLSHCVFFLHDA